MPKGEKFWNPYRWIELTDEPIERAEPLYHHCMQGISGRIECTLTALTPLIIGDGQGNFVQHKSSNQPYIPATSLKGVIRSLAEIVGNAAVPFPKVKVDSAHELQNARSENEGHVQYDIVARTFGYLNDCDVFAGLIQFSDGELTEKVSPAKWKEFEVAVGQPKPEHRAFYPDNERRKAYHHVPEADRLTGPHAGNTQTSRTRPAPPGTAFRFTVAFRNLRDEELNLLLYCLSLEEKVTVTLSKNALGPDVHESVPIKGPMRHKIGGCKPHGGGSAHIQIQRLTIRADPADRYRGKDSAVTYEGTELCEQVNQRTEQIASRQDKTMQHLRAMMIYTSDDPRRPVNYPTYQWFQEEKERPNNDKRPLKPTR